MTLVYQLPLKRHKFPCRCYYQTDVGLTEKLSSQELRDLMAREKAGSYAAEVSLVLQGIINACAFISDHGHEIFSIELVDD